MQVSQNRMNVDYLPLSMSTFEVENLGRNRGGFKWSKGVQANDPEKLLLKSLRNKLKRLLAALEREISGSESPMEPSVLETSASYSQVARREASTSMWNSGACGSAYREKLVDKLVKGAGKGVNIRIRSKRDDDD